MARSDRPWRASGSVPTLSIGVLGLVVCAHVWLGPARGADPRFYPDDPLRVDDDRIFDASNAREIVESDYYDFIRNSFLVPKEPSGRQAVNINTVGEVPDSSWFTNRLGTVAMSAVDIARGPDRFDRLSIDGWPIVEGKGEGQQPGWRVADPSGQVYQIKFDPQGYADMATGAEVIGTAFYHAMGYHVVEVYKVDVDPQGLEILPTATIRELDGTVRRFTPRDIELVLARSARNDDGSYPAIASRFADGLPLGHFRYYGMRPDDPNDLFPHEDRRELRGSRVFAAWLNHDDSHGINTLDMLQGPEDHTYVTHYMFDFGSIMGSGSVFAQEARGGNEYAVDWKRGFLTLATLGLYVQPWLKISYPEVSPAVGRFEADAFDPATWLPEYPNPAFTNLLPDDAYWAARIVAQFSDEAIQAVVEKVGYDDPRAARYLTATLIARRDKVVARWLNQVNPIENVRLDPAGLLTFDNSAVKVGAATPATSHVLRWYRFDNATGDHTQVGPAMTVSEPRAQAPAELLAGQDYVAVTLRALHPTFREWRQPARVHFRRMPEGWQTVGIDRGYDAGTTKDEG